MKRLLVVACILVVGFALLSAGYLVTDKVRRDSAVARIEAMGASVKIKRITELINPIPHRACWVDLQDTILDDQRIDELIMALDQVNLSDLRVNMGRTALTQSQKSRLMDPASHLSHRTIQSPNVELSLTRTNGGMELPSPRARLPMVVFFKNASDKRVRFYHVDEDGLEFRAALRPGRTLQAVTLLERTWLITDEEDNPLGYLALDKSVDGAAHVVISAAPETEQTSTE